MTSPSARDLELERERLVSSALALFFERLVARQELCARPAAQRSTPRGPVRAGAGASVCAGAEHRKEI